MATEREQETNSKNDRLVGCLKYSLFNDMLLLFQGHQQLINDVSFSPDGRLIASGSFDKSIKLWDGKNGKCVAIRLHVLCVVIIG